MFITRTYTITTAAFAEQEMTVLEKMDDRKECKKKTDNQGEEVQSD